MASPFSAFNFSIEIDVPGISHGVCSAAFAECDGLEMTMEAKTIREGGINDRQYRLTGPISYGTLTLKRGMTASFDLWDWFGRLVTQPGLRASAEVVVFAPDGQTEQVRFLLAACVPVKLKAPPLNARDGLIAIEELQVAYEQLKLKRPDGAGGGPGIGVSAGVSVGVSAGISLG